MNGEGINPSEGLDNVERNKEELENLIIGLFDQLEFQDPDPEHNQAILNQRKAALETFEKAKLGEKTEQEFINAKNEWSNLLEKAVDRDPNNEVIRVKSGISHSKFYFETGKVAWALENLDGSEEDDYQSGWLEYARNHADKSPEFAELYNKMNELIGLLAEYIKLGSQENSQ